MASVVKITISLEKNLARQVADIAERLGLSRSKMISLALADSLQRREDQSIIRELDSIYAVDDKQVAAETDEWVRFASASLRRIIEAEDEEDRRHD